MQDESQDSQSTHTTQKKTKSTSLWPQVRVGAPGWSSISKTALMGYLSVMVTNAASARKDIKRLKEQFITLETQWTWPHEK